MMTAPASFNRFTMKASRPVWKPASADEPAVVGMSSVA